MSEATSEATSVLAGAVAAGPVSVADAGLCGMVTLRGDLGSDVIAQALAGVGLAVPAQRRAAMMADRSALWMSPDELLLLVPHAAADSIADALTTALAGTHHLAVNVSDARALLRLTGPDAHLREALAKLAPVDMALFTPGDIRRTRLGQIACAFWMPAAGTVDLVCFRSVARYAFDLLADAAAGHSVGHLR